jgi:hypothetical protein
VGILVIAVLIGLIPGTIAKNKGHNFAGWWMFGALLFIVALPLALMMKPSAEGLAKSESEQGRQQCPHCAEFIRREALVCRYCGRDVRAAARP